MNPYLFIKSEIRSSKLALTILMLIIALAFSLSITVSLTERSVRQGSAKAADNFDILIGAKANATNLVLASVYLQEQNLPLVDNEVYQKLQKQEGIAYIAPLTFGDSYQGYKIVGTNTDFISLGNKRPLLEGQNFSKQNEAVVGFEVNLTLGNEFSPSHGMIDIPDGNDKHDHVHYKVVGRLPKTGTAWDKAILVPVESIWSAHELTEDNYDFSAIVVKALTIADAYKIRALYTNNESQAVFSGEVLTELYASLGDMRDIMTIMAVAAQVVTLCSVVLLAFFAVSLKKSSLNLLRSLGASRLYLMLSVWVLLFISISLGLILGLGIGYLVAGIIAYYLEMQSSMSLVISFSLKEISLAFYVLTIASLSSLIPACFVYKNSNIQ